MSANRELQRIFDELAAGIDLLGGNSFRASSYRRVARTLRDLATDVRELVARDHATAAPRLAELPGIGKGAAQRILEYLDRGAIAEHQELLAQVPAGVFALLGIPGIGPQAAKTLWRDLGVESVDDLRRMLERDAVAELPRMGAKTVANLRAAIDFRAKTADRVPIGRALPLARVLVARLGALEGVTRAAWAGSLRRGLETVGDLDLLVACATPEKVREAFLGMPEVERVLARGATRCSVRLRADGVSLQADLRIVPRTSWGAALLYFTGSKEHNVALRERAIRRGLRLNEYGLYRGEPPRPQQRGAQPVAAADEEGIYRALDLPWVPPELREEGVDPVLIPADLIELGDLRAELHAHTTASDGKLGIDELAAAAKARGYHTLAITDHSPSSVIARGLSPDRLRGHVAAIREADARIRGIRLLAGTEVDILPDGRLDYSDEVLAGLDVVVASPHASLRQGRAQATRRLLAAIRHPLVHVLGHPTGRFVGQRAGLDPDLPALLAAAAEHGTALELNANPRRLDLCDRHVRAALEAGCLIALNTDAHSERGFDHLPYGVAAARRAGLGRSRCLNAWTRPRLERWLARKR
ncbi:MAG TPA: DNA polymerase/3'-5' exonuclease PolX [Thermoanaerobaculia bacterium]|nr:DNA polymerase/3'-5' exonuclease PolX [Thermoanaerobaculia bacterium]